MQLANGETGKALAGFNNILEHTTDATVLAACGRALLENRQYAEGRKFLEKAAAGPNSPPDVRLDLAIALFHTTGADAALVSLEQTPVEKRGGDWYLLAAQLLISSGKYKEAMADLNRGLAASPTRPDLFFEAARLLLDYGTARSHYNEAADFLDKAARVFPADPKLLLSRAILCALLTQREEAEKALAEMELRWPDWGRPYLVNGIILVNIGRLAEAKSLLRASINLGDPDPLAYFNLALADLNDSPPELDAAQEAISQALRLAPRDPYVQWLAGKVSYTREDYQGALQHLHAALDAWPDMVEAHMQLSATYRALGEKEKCAAELQEVARIKQSPRGAVQTSPPSTPPMENLLTSVPPPP
jgi:tetratricopeptide (TPR) repeat protein